MRCPALVRYQASFGAKLQKLQKWSCHEDRQKSTEWQSSKLRPSHERFRVAPAAPVTRQHRLHTKVLDGKVILTVDCCFSCCILGSVRQSSSRYANQTAICIDDNKPPIAQPHTCCHTVDPNLAYLFCMAPSHRTVASTHDTACQLRGSALYWLIVMKPLERSLR